MTEYIQDFEMSRTKLKKHQMVIPDNILNCKMLRNAELEEKERQITFFSPDRRIRNADNRFSTSRNRMEITQLEKTEKSQLVVFVDPDSIGLVFAQKTSRRFGMLSEASEMVAKTK